MRVEKNTARGAECRPAREAGRRGAERSASPRFDDKVIKTKKREAIQKESSLFCVGVDLFSRPVARQVSSAQVSLTSVFGMGTGGPSPLKTPTAFDYRQILQYQTLFVKVYFACTLKTEQ